MPPVTSGAREGLVIATGVLLVAAIFAWRQWVERSSREEELSEADQDYYRRKDRRRFAGNAILGLIGIGMMVGSWIDFRASKLAGQRFVVVWVTVAVLVILSLVLAMIDWVANRDFAIRHRRELGEARRALFEEELRVRSLPPAGANGRDAVNGSPPAG